MRTPALLFAVLAAVVLAVPSQGDGNWPSFRGPQAKGVSDGPPTPLTWDAESGKNVRFKTPIPGLGHSSPVVWGDRVFVTTAVAADGADSELKVGLYGAPFAADDNGAQSWRVYALDKTTGEVLWQTAAHEGVPKVRRHMKASHANPTPATDGTHLVAFFGSEGLYSFDLDGKLRWKKDLGVLDAGSYRSAEMQWGFGNSPVLHDGKVIIQADHRGESFLAVFDAADGRELWRRDRDDYSTWGTPTLYETGEKTLVLVNGYKHMGAYDFADGSEVWKLSGGGDVPVPTPVTAHGLIFLTNAHGAKSPVYAVRANARGDITLAEEDTANEGIAWSIPRGGAYMQTPLVYGDELYVCRDNGALSSFDARTGERHYQERLASGEGFTSSAVASGGRIYFTSEMGDTHVVKAGKSFEKLGVNRLGEVVMSTPAISEGVLYFRTRYHLVAIGE